jgi:hypothetical protein
LADPVSYPSTRKEGDKTVPTATVFLRPPRGTASAGTALPDNQLLYRYQVQNNAPFKTVFVGADQQEIAAFEKEVLKPFPGLELKNAAAVQVTGRGGRTLTFHRMSYDDGQYRNLVYVYTTPPYLLIVVYQLEKTGQDANVDLVVEMSLGTMAFGSEASMLLAAFSGRRK